MRCTLSTEISRMKALLVSFALLAFVAAPGAARAASAEEINADANATLHRFVEQIQAPKSSGARLPVS